MKIAIILNKNSGAINNEKEDYSPEIIKSTFKRAGVDCEIYHVEGKEILQKVKIILKSDVDAVAAAGGDGTISAASAGLAGTNTPLGILPFGTLNHFAKDNNIPLDFEEAVKVIANKNIIKVDSAEINGRIFINNSSIGFYPKVVKHRDNQIERLGGRKWIAMGAAFINVLKRFSSFEVDIHSDGKKIKTKAPFVFIGNNKYQMDLFNLGTRVKINEGYLSLYFPNTTGLLSMIRFAFLALINKLNQSKDFNIIQTKEITIKTRIKRRKKIEVSVDGEVIHLSPPLNYKIRPLDLMVIVPQAKS